MKIVYDFIAGNIPFEDFWREFHRNREIQEWFDTAGNYETEEPVGFPRDQLLRLYYRQIRNQYKGHAMPLLPLDVCVSPDEHHYSAPEKYDIFSTIEVVLRTIEPKLSCTKAYKQDADYYEKAVSSSIGGPEVWRFTESVLEQFPRTMKAAERVKAGRAAIQEAFHIHDRKFPCWPQEPDWPMGKDSPMEYIGRHKDGELVQLRFRDVDTGEEKIVEQFY